ncbi:MAG: hypothetical protein ABIE94_02170 [archaeon]
MSVDEALANMKPKFRVQVSDIYEYKYSEGLPKDLDEAEEMIDVLKALASATGQHIPDLVLVNPGRAYGHMQGIVNYEHKRTGRPGIFEAGPTSEPLERRLDPADPVDTLRVEHAGDLRRFLDDYVPASVSVSYKALEHYVPDSNPVIPTDYKYDFLDECGDVIVHVEYHVGVEINTESEFGVAVKLLRDSGYEGEIRDKKSSSLDLPNTTEATYDNEPGKQGELELD